MRRMLVLQINYICKVMPIDLLQKYNGVCHIDLKEGGLITETPKKVRDFYEIWIKCIP